MSTQTQPTSLRIGARDLKSRLDSGERATVLDARGQQAYESSDRRIRGDVRYPGDFRADASWPRDRLTVVY